MTDEIKKIAKKYRGAVPDVYGRTEWNSWDEVEGGLTKEIETLISSHFIAKDKVREIAERCYGEWVGIAAT